MIVQYITNTGAVIVLHTVYYTALNQSTACKKDSNPLHILHCTLSFAVIRGGPKKSGLASKPVTLDLEHRELNGQVLLIPHIICVNLVYSSFF